MYADGSVRPSTFGDAVSLNLGLRITGGARVPTGGGYWEVAADGNVFGYGTAPALGGMGGFPINAPIFAIASTPSAAIIPNPVAQGYRLVTDSGRTIPRGAAPGGDRPTTTNRVCGRATARIELPATTMVAGERMTGFLVVDNQTRKPVQLSTHGCRPLWAVSVSSEAIPNSPVFAHGCFRRPLTFPVGATQHPFTMQATYLIGLNPCKCLGPLPPGDYVARLFNSSRFLPAASVPIRVTAPPT